MPVTGFVSLIIIVVTCILSYKGFKSMDFLSRMEFEVEKILVYRDYKRLVTSAFVHSGWQHLIFNMITLFFFSFNLESFFGPLRFLLIYFISELGGSLLSLFIHRRHPSYSAVGASGAINGVVFASIAVFPGMNIFFIPGWLYGLLYVLISIYGIRSQKENIGHDSHLGGAIVGMLVAIAFYPQAVRDNWLAIVLILIPTVAFMIVIIKKPQLLLVDSYWFRHQYNYTVDDRENLRHRNTQKEVDRILEKIHRRGINSLSKKERDLLEEFSRK